MNELLDISGKDVLLMAMHITDAVVDKFDNSSTQTIFDSAKRCDRFITVLYKMSLVA